MILEDIKPEGEGINSLVIAACSPRVKYEELDFPNVLVERCNIRENVAWTQEPNVEETQNLAEDYLRMYCAGSRSPRCRSLTRASATRPSWSSAAAPRA